MFDIIVDPKGNGDFRSITEAIDHYNTQPWWKRAVRRVFRSWLTIQEGTYPETFQFPYGVWIKLGFEQTMIATIVGADGSITVQKL